MFNGINIKNPKVTVLMSVYNGEKYLREAIDSILNQTYKDFEFLIIDDGSTDKTGEILQSYQDSRIKIVVNEKSIGLTKSLNKGFKMANGEYIACMDADGISCPNRLEEEVAFLEQNLDYSLVGAFAEVITRRGKIIRELNFNTYSEILSNILYDNCFTHGSIMVRKAVLDEIGYYNEQLEFAQDYELNLRLVFYSKAKNIPEFLYAWRDDPKSNISTKRRKKQRCNIGT